MEGPHTLQAETPRIKILALLLVQGQTAKEICLLSASFHFRHLKQKEIPGWATINLEITYVRYLIALI